MPHKLLPAALYAVLAMMMTIPVSAQTSSTLTSTPTNITTAPSTTIQNWPVKTIFYPLHLPPNLGASIITAHANATAYAITCLPSWAVPSPSSPCGLRDPITVTEGPSTLVYTLSYINPDQSTDNAAPTTINCNLAGSPSITAATCTGRSAISGLGTLASTSTLSQSQILFAEVTVTAGESKLDAVPSGLGRNGDGGGSSSSGVALVVRPVATAGMLVVGFAGAAGVFL